MNIIKHLKYINKCCNILMSNNKDNKDNKDNNNYFNKII